MTTNKPMTGEQLDELMTVAVNMQRDSEKAGERSIAMFAYAVQVAVLELRNVREIKPADEDHVAAMNSITAIIANLGLSDPLGISEQVAELKAQRDALAAENGQMLRLLTDISENHDEYVNQDEYLCAGVPMDYVSEINAYVSRDVEAENPFKETDDFLAELRAQGVDMMVEQCESDIMLIESEDEEHYTLMIEHAKEFAAQLRKGAQS
ncbi:hypothetical protein [Enterobacter sp.]|uniref:hypothetical protein n=1 Tax=Enterobacter sp. TaxID=42895 RepID=UPI0039E4E6C5